MFSSIKEAWDKDPVKDMTRRLKQGEFTSPPKSPLSRRDPDRRDLDSESSIQSLNLSSDMNGDHSDSDDNYASISFGGLKSQSKKFKSPFKPSMKTSKQSMKRSSKRQSPHLFEMTDDSDESDYDETDQGMTSECGYSMRHLKKCGQCYRKLMKLIDKKVKRKNDDFIFDTKMRQIQSQTPSSSQLSNNNNNNQPFINTNDSFKETLIIVSGAIIVIFIIFLITKSVGSR